MPEDEPIHYLDPADYVEPDFNVDREIYEDARQNRASMAEVERIPEGYRWRDPVHGEHQIDDPMIVSLMETSAFQRLWDVQQLNHREACMWQLRSRPHTRAEHSLGVYWLVANYTEASPAARAAALLHDVGHPVWSHHGERVFETSTQQNWHERQLEQIVTDEAYGVLPVLREACITPEQVIDLESHPLLDQSLPDLCADRIDYILRDSVAAGWLPADHCQYVTAELRVTDDHQDWYVAKPEMAELFRRALERADYYLYRHPAMREAGDRLRDILAMGLRKGYVSERTIAEGTETTVMERLQQESATDRELAKEMAWLRDMAQPRSRMEAILYGMDHYGLFADDDIHTKKRAVDPLCQFPGDEGNPVVMRLSECKKRGFRLNCFIPMNEQRFLYLDGVRPDLDPSMWPEDTSASLS